MHASFRSPSNKRNGSINSGSSLPSPPRNNGLISPLLPALPNRTPRESETTPKRVVGQVERHVEESHTSSRPASNQSAQVVPASGSSNPDILQRIESTIAALQRQVHQLSTQLNFMQVKEREMSAHSEVKSALDDMLARVSDEAYLELRKNEWKAFGQVIELELKSRDDEFSVQLDDMRRQLSTTMQVKEHETVDSEVKSVLDGMLTRVSDDAYLELRKNEWKAFGQVIELELKSRDDEFSVQLNDMRRQLSATAAAATATQSDNDVKQQQQARLEAEAAKARLDALASKFEAALQQPHQLASAALVSAASSPPPARAFPTLPVDDGPMERIAPAKYDVFLSHKRMDCADFCRVLHTELTHRGYQVFLDEEASDDISDLLSHVRASHHVVWVLSSNVFDSTWCLREVRAALRARIPIQPVVHQGAQWGGHDFPPEEWVPSEVSQALSTTKATAYRREYHKEFITRLAARLGPPKVNAPSHQHTDVIDPFAGRQ